MSDTHYNKEEEAKIKLLEMLIDIINDAHINILELFNSL
jgi:hypothetical protein